MILTVNKIIINNDIDNNPFYHDSYLSKTGSGSSQGSFFLLDREDYEHIFIYDFRLVDEKTFICWFNCFMYPCHYSYNCVFSFGKEI